MNVTHSSLVARAHTLVGLCSQGGLHHYAALRYLSSNFLVLPSDGFTREALEAVGHVCRVQHLRVVLETCRANPFCLEGITELRHELRDPYPADLITEVGTTREELAQLWRRAFIAVDGSKAFFDLCRRIFGCDYAVHFRERYHGSFDDVMMFFREYAVDPVEIGTSLDAIRARWHAGKVKLAKQAWKRRLDSPFLNSVTIRDLEYALANGVEPREFGTTPDELGLWLRQAATTYATELVEEVNWGGTDNIDRVHELSTRYELRPDDIGLRAPLASLRDGVLACRQADHDRTSQVWFERACQSHGLVYSADLTSDERAALERTMTLMDTRTAVGGECVHCDIDCDGGPVRRLHWVGHGLYVMGITHDEAGITRDEFITQMVRALVDESRDELRALMDVDPTAELEYDYNGHPKLFPKGIVGQARALVEAGITAFDELGVNPEALGALARIGSDD